MYCLVLLEQVFGQLSSPWLQAGLTASLSASHNRGDLYGLNRRMMRGDLQQNSNGRTTSSPPRSNQVAKLLLRTSDPRKREKIRGVQ